MEIAGYVGAVLIGAMLGLLGGGGSILAIPILVYLFKLDIVSATAYSLFIVGTSGIPGLIPKYKAGQISFDTGLLFGIPSMFSVFFTRKWVVPAIPDVPVTVGQFMVTKRLLLLGLFALLMIAASYYMIKGKNKYKKSTRSKHMVLLIGQGLVIGLLTGLVGAGGGFLIIPALVLLAGLSMKVATGTSLFIISTNSLVGFMGDFLNLSIDWTLLLSLAFLSLIGILIGNKLVALISGENLRKSFGRLTLIMGSWVLVKELFLS